MMPEPLAEVHPTAARAAGIRDGEEVRLSSPNGEVRMRAKVTDRVHPETVVIPAGWAGTSANLLTSSEALDPISGFPTLRSVPCRIEPVH